jgi:predicted RNase H-like nuclease (RuvC/YqgF family)
MVRPRKLKEKGVVIGVHIEYSYAFLIEEIARREGKSVSELLREVIVGWLEGEAREKYGFRLATQQDDDVRELEAKLAEDPVLEAELKDLEQAVERLESDALALEYKVDDLIAKKYDLRTFIRWDDIQALRERWQRLKKWYYSVRRQAGPVRVRHIAQTLVRAKDAIDRCAEKYINATRRVREV